MAKKGNGGNNKGGHHDDDDMTDHVIEFTPDAGFNIRSMAKSFSEMMEEVGLPVLIHLPHVSVEFEPGCTPQEIIDGYKQAMKHKFTVKHSNTNEKPAGPKR